MDPRYEKILFVLLEYGLKKISPKLRTLLQESIVRLRVAADQTANPIDNLLVEVLADLIGE